MPAQVPNTGFPAAICAAIGSNKPVERSNLPCVVLSPPGRITRSIESSKSSAARSSFHGAPSRSSIAACSANAPCTARMPVTPCCAEAAPSATSVDSSFEMYSTATTIGSPYPNHRESCETGCARRIEQTCRQPRTAHSARNDSAITRRERP